MTEEEIRRVKAVLGDGRTICDQCGATLKTYHERCNVALAVRCQGFDTVEAAASGRVVAGQGGRG